MPLRNQNRIDELVICEDIPILQQWHCQSTFVGSISSVPYYQQFEILITQLLLMQTTIETQLKSQFENNVIGYKKDTKDYYFDSYSHFSIHEQMLKDSVRTQIYMKSILKNPELFRDRVVLDVGSGTGVLSIFAAKAGARHVYAVQNANIYIHSKRIIQQNHLGHKITVINGKIEEIQLPVKQVDIIISEWMGYFLIYESMLDSVLFARDKWLTQDGIMLPDHATMYIAAIEDNKYFHRKLGFWDEVYGIKMKCMKKWVISQPLIDTVMKERVVSNTTVLLEIDLYQIKQKQLDFSSEFKLKINQNTIFNGFIAWFTTQFNHGKHKYTLSTSPFRDNTHWKQTIFYIEQPIEVDRDQVIEASLIAKKSKDNFRQIDIVITYEAKQVSKSQFYRIT